jgi:ribosomal-protein-alanine N-acetyltransferase
VSAAVAVEAPIVVTPMRRRHLRGVVQIEQQTNHRPWSHGLFAGELRLPTSRLYLVALSGSVVLGFGGAMFTGYEAHITNVAVDPAHHRRQIGTRLMLVLLRGCASRGVEDVTLEVRATNRAAQELYRRFGFAPGGIRPNYYADLGEDALIMWAHDIREDRYGQRLDELESKLATKLWTDGC